MGAMLGGATARDLEALSDYGRDLALTYQLVDEALTVCGHQTQMGRALVPDLLDGIYGFPILHVLQSEGAERMRAALALLRGGGQGVAAVHALARECGGVQAALERAGVHADRARHAVRDVASSSVRAAFLGLVDYALARAAVLATDSGGAARPPGGS